MASNLSEPSLSGPSYRKTYNPIELETILRDRGLSEEQIHAIRVVSTVLPPPKTTGYVINELIDWCNAPDDPIFRLIFSHRDMLTGQQFREVSDALNDGDRNEVRRIAGDIRRRLNPNPAGQMEHNVPALYGERLEGIQHKYPETILFFPAEGQNCFSNCTYCFRWPQLVPGERRLKFASYEIQNVVRYLQAHPKVTDIIFTGGDPITMGARTLDAYVSALLDTSIQSIRIGSKSLAYWPHRFLVDNDSSKLLEIFQKITRSGRHLAFMAHFSHPRELETPSVQEAIGRIQETGAIIRTQAPVMKHINDSADVWADMLNREVRLVCIPYYMFIGRDTGAQNYFAVPLARAFEIYRKAVSKVSGIGRTIRGPVMSAHPGKVRVSGISEIDNEKVFLLEFIQARNPGFVGRTFFARYDDDATWLDDLKPAFGKQKFFFEEGAVGEKGLEQIVNQ